MAVYWNLGLVTRTREEAHACVEFFRGKNLFFEDLGVPLEVSTSERPDGWVVCVWPRGMSHGSPMGNIPRLTEDHARGQIARTFDAWLRVAPQFTAAFFGGEAFDYFLDSGVSDLEANGIEGLVVDEATWVSLGRPVDAQPVAAGRFAWRRSRVP